MYIIKEVLHQIPNKNGNIKNENYILQWQNLVDVIRLIYNCISINKILIIVFLFYIYCLSLKFETDSVSFSDDSVKAWAFIFIFSICELLCCTMRFSSWMAELI
jgi:hypothetical protein